MAPRLAPYPRPIVIIRDSCLSGRLIEGRSPPLTAGLPMSDRSAAPAFRRLPTLRNGMAPGPNRPIT